MCAASIATLQVKCEPGKPSSGLVKLDMYASMCVYVCAGIENGTALCDTLVALALQLIRGNN